MRALRIISVIACLCVLTLSARADESAYWRARVSASIHLQAEPVNPWLPPVPLNPQPKVTAEPKADQRRQVKMYVATWCAPCQSAKATIKVSTLPFDVEFVDVSSGGQPGWCSTIPAFAWDVRGQTRYVLGFPGARQLVTTWENSQKPVKVSASNGYPAFSGYRPHWTWPRSTSLQDHLRLSHGVSEAGSLTREQAEQLHDALHNGVSLQAIKRYAISKGLIKQ